MDVLFRSIGTNMLDSNALLSTMDSLQACDPSEGALAAASQYIDSVFAPENHLLASMRSRAATPMNVGTSLLPPNPGFHSVNSCGRQTNGQNKCMPGAFPDSNRSSPSGEQPPMLQGQ